MKKAMPAGRQGFTLIELLVVIAIMAIIISVSLVASVNARKSGRDGKRRADLEQIRSALEIYRNDQKTYPALLTDLTGGEIYMAEVPTDPLATQGYLYKYTWISANAYTLCASLEAGGSSTGCPTNCGTALCNYKVTNP